MSRISVLSAAGLALAAAIATPGTASAQLMLPGTASYDWSGFYAGLSAGGASVKSKLTTNVCSSAASTCYWTSGSSGGNATTPGRIAGAGAGSVAGTLFSGGIQAGYNYQVQSFLLGAELDLVSLNSKLRHRGTTSYVAGTTTPGANILDSVTTGPLVTLRARGGYTFGNLLLFGTGGAAFGSVERDVYYNEYGYGPANGCLGADPGKNYCSNKSQTLRVGWTAGGGAEWAFLPNWSLKAEYLYVDLGSRNANSTLQNGNGTGTYSQGGSAQTLNHTVDFRAHVARLGINYRF